jgi:pimeloyl-ACP methyl ester carboxylesterase
MPAHLPAEAFFLASAPGERFCLYHAPAGVCRGALVYVHPFAEEMNKSRRMAALQARALAAAGFGVLQIDLHGCGDSDGDFGDARWEQWHADLATASSWLHARLGQPVGLWGLRLGALLALDHARRHTVHQLVLWQPVLQGAAFLTQFLRLLVASGMLDEDAPRFRPPAGNRGLPAGAGTGIGHRCAGCGQPGACLSRPLVRTAGQRRARAATGRRAHRTAMGRAGHRQSGRRAVLVHPGDHGMPGADRRHLRRTRRSAR